MAINVLIIDDSRDFCSLLRLFLNKEFDDVEITEFDFKISTKPKVDFPWKNYDVLLLDYKLGPDQDGLEWLKEFSQQKKFPPTIVLTAEGDEYIAVRAIKLGAADYINKKDVSAKRLSKMISEAIEFTPKKRNEYKRDANEASKILDMINTGERFHEDETDIGYKCIRRIGNGAMSDVFLAERESDEQTLVLKILNLNNVDNDVYKRRFVREAELLIDIESPFVVKVYDFGTTKQYAYIAMEFLPRGDLKQRLELGFDIEVANSYLNQVLRGLNEIHSVGIIHRDIKPANIMFHDDDGLAIADFGISKKMIEAHDLTETGQVLGTPHYMSPEQGEGKIVDARSDLYSIGIMYYEFLTKKKPFEGTTASALIYQHVYGQVPTLEGELACYQGIVNKAIAKNPEERYQTAEEFLEVLVQAEQGVFI